MDKDKLIERLRKLYAMSQDASSPAEAAIAAKRARRLMDVEGLTLEDIENSKPNDFGEADAQYAQRQIPAWIEWMAVEVAKLNDCNIVRTGAALRFRGFASDTVAARLLLDYLVESCNRQCKAHLKDTWAENKRKAGTDFRRGFAVAMNKRLKAMSAEREQQQTSDGRSLVVIKSALVADRYGEQRTRADPTRIRASRSFGAGVQAGKRTGLNTQVSRSSRTALN